MQQTILGRLPVKPAMLSFIRWREGLTPDQPLQVPGRSPIASFLEIQFSFCILFHSDGFFPPPPAPKLKDCSAHLVFELGGAVASEHVFQLLDHVANHFNSFCYALAIDDMNRAIIEGKRRHVQEKTTVEQFLRDTGMDDHFDFDAAIKASYRARKGKLYPSFRGFASWEPAAGAPLAAAL